MAKTGPTCSICASKFRHQVEIGLTHCVPARALAARFSLSADAILRHSHNHLTPAMRAAILTASKPSAVDLDALRVSESEGLLAQLVAQRARLQTHSELAADLGDIRAAVAAEGAILSNLGLVGKLLGQIVSQHHVTTTSILVSPDYLKLRATLVAALKPFPDAARAVGAALHRLESDAARDITAAAAKGKAPAMIEHQAAPPPRTIPPPPC